MPIRCHGSLLGQLGIVLGICTASGCQSLAGPGDWLRSADTAPGAGRVGRVFETQRPTQSPLPAVGVGQAFEPDAPRQARKPDLQKPVLPVAWQPGQNADEHPGPDNATRVSQWRGMRRSGETAAVPLVPPGWDAPPPSLLPSGVVTAKTEEPPSTPLPMPREVPGSSKDHHQKFPVNNHEFVAPVDPYAVAGMAVPREGAKVSLPPYVLEPPDILLIESNQGLKDQPIRGQHLIRPDGTVNLGIYGSVLVGGLTIDQAKEVIARQFATRITNFDLRTLNVDVLAYNSKFYYVVTDGGGYGEQVFRLPITGSETVLDGISQIYGLPAVASKHRIWVARRSADGMSDQVLPVDWNGIVRAGATATNYQILPGDRIYVDANRWVRFDTKVARFLSPFERIFGFTLLGSETVNSIAGRGTFGGTTR